MANKYGVNYTKEFIQEPSEKAAKATRNAPIKCNFEEVTGVASGDEVFLCKLNHKAIFLGLESIVGALGAGDVKIVDKAGNETVIAKGDLVNGQVEGGVSVVLVADGTTAASLKVLVKFLMD